MMVWQRAVAATLLGVLATVFTFHGRAVSQEQTPIRDAFFESLMGGGAENGLVYVEMPLKRTFFAAANSAKERWAVWDTFFGRVLRESPDMNRLGSAPYW